MYNNINLHTVTQHKSIGCAFYEHFQNVCLKKHTHDRHINTHTCIQIQKHTHVHILYTFFLNYERVTKESFFKLKKVGEMFCPSITRNLNGKRSTPVDS